jgi:hypothetical protein
MAAAKDTATDTGHSPRLVLRVAFAGLRDMQGEEARGKEMLTQVFGAICMDLEEISPAVEERRGKVPPGGVVSFYSGELPLLRLITGLCEGGDDLADQALQGVTTRVERELAAVLPCDVVSYRRVREEGFAGRFDEQAQRCAYIMTLDGYCEKPEPDTELAARRRHRAYRAQCALLLRQADILIALADSGNPARAGMTMETVRAAHELQMPVVFADVATGFINVIDPSDDPFEAFADLDTAKTDWRQHLSDWLLRIIADPDIPGLTNGEPSDAGDKKKKVDQGYSTLVIKTYFKCKESFKGGVTKDRKIGRGEKLWNRLMKRCEEGTDARVPEPEREPFSTWRRVSSTLNYKYSGDYRGTFFSIYLIAAIAVLLALLSLFFARWEGEYWCFVVLAILGLFKLIMVWQIKNLTNAVTDKQLNELAVDFRYFSERLRAMLYLPLLGCFRLPMPRAAGLRKRAVRQSATDWLLSAVVRQVSPGGMSQMTTYQELSYPVRVLEISPATALQDLKEHWVGGQSVYHSKTARGMERLNLFFEGWGKILNWLVIGVVIVDLTILIFTLIGRLDGKSHVHLLTPVFLFLTALLPAVVASLNGVRYQSECNRLAERSSLICTVLRGAESTIERKGSLMDRLFIRKSKAPKVDNENMTPGGRYAEADKLIARIQRETANPTGDLGAWAPVALQYAESLAEFFMDEVNEWSVLYAKELPES